MGLHYFHADLHTQTHFEKSTVFGKVFMPELTTQLQKKYPVQWTGCEHLSNVELCQHQWKQ